MRGNTCECIEIAVVSIVKEFHQPRTEPKAEIPEKVFRGRFELPSPGISPGMLRLHYRKELELALLGSVLIDRLGGRSLGNCDVRERGELRDLRELDWS